jgi:hypothetical protein
MEHFYHKTEGEDWFTFAQLYTEVVNKFGPNSRFVEVGAWKGRSAAYLAVENINSGKNHEINIVDTWDGSPEHLDPSSWAYNKDILEDPDWLYNVFLKNVNPVINNINPIRKPSLEAVKDFEDGSLDFVYIDAAHEYEDVKADIIAWLPKLKPTGMIAGHDYNTDAPGVKQAVDEMFSPYIIETRDTRSWVVNIANYLSQKSNIDSPHKKNFDVKIFSNFVDPNNPMYIPLKELKKPITFFYDYIPKTQEELNHNPYNFIMLHEPNEFFGMHDWVKQNYTLFDGILTYNQDILNSCPNATHYHHFTSKFTNEEIKKFNTKFNQKLDKKFEISFLSGAKNLVEGHNLRQEIYKLGEKINIPKKWKYTLDDFNSNDFNNGGIGRPDDARKMWEGKKYLFEGSMFHIAIENVNQPNWYTEKICDAFATKTLPIYWGCENIGDLGYDERGIIRFKDLNDLVEIINSLTPEIYFEKLSYIEHNYKRSLLEKPKNQLLSFFQEIIELNDL